MTSRKMLQHSCIASSLVWIVILLVVTMCGRSGVTARDVNILNLVWLTDGKGELMSNFELVSSSFLFPIAIKHFNERYTGIIPEIAQFRNCNVVLKLSDGLLHDTEGVSSNAMSTFLNNTKIDVILGVGSSDVSSSYIHACTLENRVETKSAADSQH